MESSLPVVVSCLKELGENIVAVGRADEPSYRKSHLECKIAGHYIAEVTGRDDEVYLVAVVYPSVFNKLAVRGEVVYDLRNQSSYVY